MPYPSPFRRISNTAAAIASVCGIGANGSTGNSGLASIVVSTDVLYVILVFFLLVFPVFLPLKRIETAPPAIPPPIAVAAKITHYSRILYLGQFSPLLL